MKPSLPDPQSSNGRVLVVIDDERGVLDLLSDIFEMAGLSAVCLDRPEQIERLGTEAAPYLFLIDMMLPGTSGIELAQQLRTTSFTGTPMIAISASVEMVKVAKGSGLFQDAIRKPFDVQELLATVGRYLPQG